MRNIKLLSALAICLVPALLLSACDHESAPSGALSSVPHPSANHATGLNFALGAGIDTAKIKVVVKQVACGTEPLNPALYLEQIYDVSGSNHKLNDQFLTVDPGCYDILALPLQEDGATPSELCPPISVQKAVVLDGDTTEVALIGTCDGIPQGALDVFVLFNAPPNLKAVTYLPSKFVPYCTQQVICAEFYDPDGDQVELEWTQVSGIPLQEGPTVIDGSFEYDAASGISKQCAMITQAGPGTVGIQIKAYDLMQNTAGELIRIDDYLKGLGFPGGSFDSMLLPAHGEATGDCACVPGAFPEQCDIFDNDCDGQNNEDLECACMPFEKRACYSGPEGTEGKGSCHAGVQVCALDGSAFGETCIGESLPKEEICDGEDNNCNGMIDEGLDCCKPSDTIDTLDGQYCRGYDLIGVFNNKNCGPYEVVMEGCSSLCGAPTYGQLLRYDCIGADRVAYYADESCGTFSQVIELNSPSCIDCPMAGTPLTHFCSGSDLYARYADGVCGALSTLILSNASQCGGTCGNSTCEATEDCQSCPLDCVVCGG